MKTNKLLIYATVAAVATIGLIAALAQTTTASGSGRILQRIAVRLNLADDQKARIKTVLGGEKDLLTPFANRAAGGACKFHLSKAALARIVGSPCACSSIG